MGCMRDRFWFSPFDYILIVRNRYLANQFVWLATQKMCIRVVCIFIWFIVADGWEKQRSNQLIACTKIINCIAFSYYFIYIYIYSDDDDYYYYFCQFSLDRTITRATCIICVRECDVLRLWRTSAIDFGAKTRFVSASLTQAEKHLSQYASNSMHTQMNRWNNSNNYYYDCDFLFGYLPIHIFMGPIW